MSKTGAVMWGELAQIFRVYFDQCHGVGDRGRVLSCGGGERETSERTLWETFVMGGVFPNTKDELN